MDQYDDLAFKLYSSDWTEMITNSKKKRLKDTRKIFTIFLQNLNSETKIVIGKVVVLGLSSFSSVKFTNIRNKNLSKKEVEFVVTTKTVKRLQ